MAAILPALLVLFLLAAPPVAFAEPATARYAPAQLRVALDARLAWGMSESPQLRADAAAVGGAASALIAHLAGRGRQ